MIECVIGLGANLNNPQQQVLDACQHLLAEVSIEQFQLSSLYSSTPMGPQDQPNYVNAVAIFNTSLMPHALLDLLQHIEQLHGRVRIQHWGPRTLDLDLLFYGNETINDTRLTVPHPGILEREFVIVPLAELRPNYLLPNNKTALIHANALNLYELQVIHSGLPIN